MAGYDEYRLHLDTRIEEKVRIAKGKGAVASISKQASELGIEVLKDGGNAFDAAFAVAFALTIYHPQAGNIGGGGYILYKKKGFQNPLCINYREKSPSRVKKELYLTENGSADPEITAFGPASVCVPGTVKGFFTLHKKYGSLTEQDLLEHLSKLSQKGCRINRYQAQCLNRLNEKLSYSPESRKIYGMKGRPFEEGDVIPNPDLAETFLILAREGERAFYEGEIAECIERDLTENSGFITVQDLKNYTIKEVEPICTEVKGRLVWSVPPEGGGAILIEMLNILNRDSFFRIKPYSPDFFHFLAQSFKMASVDRLFYLGDVSLADNSTYRDIFRRDYTERLFSFINRERDIKTDSLLNHMHPNEANIFKENGKRITSETTHFSIIDNEGNAVSNSYTLNLRYGSKWSVNGAGFLLNGSIDAFSFSPGQPNYFGVIGNTHNMFAPNKRPASNMAPVLVTRDREVEVIMGTPGGPAIPTSAVTILMLVLGRGMPPTEVIQKGRIHHQGWPDILYTEQGSIPDDIIDGLSQKGYMIQDKNEPIGDIHGIFRDSRGYTAVSDFRREGHASAY